MGLGDPKIHLRYIRKTYLLHELPSFSSLQGPHHSLVYSANCTSSSNIWIFLHCTFPQFLLFSLYKRLSGSQNGWQRKGLVHERTPSIPHARGCPLGFQPSERTQRTRRGHHRWLCPNQSRRSYARGTRSCTLGFLVWSLSSLGMGKQAAVNDMNQKNHWRQQGCPCDST